MSKLSNLTIRLERDDFIEFEAIAKERGRSVPEHLHHIIDDILIYPDGHMLDRMMYDIAYFTIASHHLLTILGDQNLLDDLYVDVMAEAERLGVGLADW